MGRRARRIAFACVAASVAPLMAWATGACFYGVPDVAGSGDGRAEDGGDAQAPEGSIPDRRGSDAPRGDTFLGDGNAEGAVDVATDVHPPDTGVSNVLVSGRCQPVGIVAFGGFVFWGESSSTGTGSIQVCIAPACTSQKAVVARPNPVYDLVSNGTAFVWAEGAAGGGAKVVTASSTGTGLTVLASIGAGLGPGALAIDDKYAYWTEGGPTATDVDSVKSAPLSGSGPIATLAQGMRTLSGVASDGTDMYWTYWNGNTLTRCPRAGCDGGSTVLSSGFDAGGPQPVVLNSGILYWANASNTPFVTAGVITQVSSDGGPVSVLSPGPGLPTAILADPTNAYWPDYLRGTISRCARAGCSQTPTVLFKGSEVVPTTRVASDLTHVYFTSYGSMTSCTGAVMVAPN